MPVTIYLLYIIYVGNEAVSCECNTEK